MNPRLAAVARIAMLAALLITTPLARSAPPQAASSASGASAPASVPLGLPADSYVLLRLSEATPLLPAAAKDKDKDEGAKDLVAALVPLAWPLAALLIAWWLFRSPAIQLLLNTLPRNITQLNVAGLEIKLSPGAKATIADLEQLIKQVPEIHKDWLANTYLGPQFQLLVTEIKTYLTDKTATGRGAPLSNEEYGKFRFTLHVPDVLLDHSFRQLLNYSGSSRGGAGRLYSTRIGIIGKAWRMERSEYLAHKSYSEEQLVEIWGMTLAEARDTSSKAKEFVAVLLKSAKGLPLAVLYGDADGSKLFDASRYLPNVPTEREVFTRLEAHIRKTSIDCGLIDSLQQLDEQRRKVRQLDVYGARGG